jgi:hypothetical protein
MSRFLKLTSMVINTSHISSISICKEIVPNQIKINLIQDDFFGFILFGSGYFTSNKTVI